MVVVTTHVHRANFWHMGIYGFKALAGMKANVSVNFVVKYSFESSFLQVCLSLKGSLRNELYRDSHEI